MRKKTKPSHTDQHVIPNCYLKAWGDTSLINFQTKQPFKIPHIWIYNKSDNTCEHYPTKTNFTKEDFYTLYNDKSERDLTIEHEFAKVEKNFSDIRDKKLLKNDIFTEDEHSKICLFIATMHSRTESRLDHISNMFNPIMDKMNDMIEYSKTATTQQLKAMGIASSISKNTATHTELINIIENPLKEIMIPFINHEAEEFLKLNLAIFYTKESIGFITSDTPCIWYDSKAHERNQMFQSPGLKYDSIEIILPISPSHCILLNKKLKGYIDIDTNPEILKQINSIIYQHSDNSIISNNIINKDLFT